MTSATPVPPSALVSTERWREDDLGLAWVGEFVDIGDSGAAMVGGKNLNNESVAVYGAGSGTPIFDTSPLNAYSVRVALTKRAPVAAAVGISDDGNSILVVVSNASGVQHLRVFDAAGTPTILAYDEGGTQTAAVTTPGSVFAVALDDDGDVIAAGSKAVHANTFGSGGSFWCVDAADRTLSVLGDAMVGGPLTLESPDGATAITFAFSSALGASPSAFGTTEIDLGATSERTTKVSIRLQP